MDRCGSGGITVEDKEVGEKMCVFGIDLVDGIFTTGRGVSMGSGERKKEKEGDKREREQKEGQDLG